MAPPFDQLVPPYAHDVQYLTDDKIYQFLHRLWVVVETRCCRDHDATGLCDRRHILEMHEAVRHLPLQDHQPLALLQGHVSDTVEEVCPGAVSDISYGRDA